MENTLSSNGPPPNRIMPKLDPDNKTFWTSGADGVLRIVRCSDCGHYVHPPTTMCPECESFEVSPQPVSGEGTVVSFTINRYRWREGFEPPYCVAMIELVEQQYLRIVANILDVDLDEITAGMKVRVGFQRYDEIFVPVFSARSVTL